MVSRKRPKPVAKKITQFFCVRERAMHIQIFTLYKIHTQKHKDRAREEEEERGKESGKLHF